MRHLVTGRKLGRNASHRKAMFKNTAMNIIKHERIKTTQAKAKELRKVVDKLITWGKKGDLHSRRLARTYVADRELLRKLFGELKDRFASRKGGYTRIIKLNPRSGDAASMALIELIPDAKSKPKGKTAKPKKKAKKETKKEAKADSKEKDAKKESKKADAKDDEQIKAKLKDSE